MEEFPKRDIETERVMKLNEAKLFAQYFFGSQHFPAQRSEMGKFISELEVPGLEYKNMLVSVDDHFRIEKSDRGYPYIDLRIKYDLKEPELSKIRVLIIKNASERDISEFPLENESKEEIKELIRNAANIFD